VKRIIILIVLLIPLFVLAQPGGGDPGGDPDVPIAGIEWLLLSGGIFGARKLYKKFRQTK
jgi:hypothetical protein